MAGYSTQSHTFSTGSTIEASHINDEVTALIAAFHASTGHAHDGTAGEGARLTITDIQGGTQYAIPVLNGAGNDITASSAFSSGQLLIGQSATVPDAKTISGDITLAADGTVAIASDVIVNADINASAAIDMSKTALVAGTGLTLSTNTLSVDASQTQITAVGTIATGTWEGTDVGVAHGGTGASTASAARTNLGVAIGSNVQAHGDVLDDLNTLGAATTDGEFIVATGAGAFAYESGATARTSLGLGSIATQASSSVTITGGSISGITDLAVADGGTGASTVAGARTNLGLVIGTDVQAYDADILKADTADVLTAGFAATAYNAGTKSSGTTYTPASSDGNFQYATNNGAHTLAPPTTDCTIVIHYTNGAAAGTITTSGFTNEDVSEYLTTNNYEFLFYITRCNSKSFLQVKALQ